MIPGRALAGPLALMLWSAPFVMCIWYAICRLDGSLFALYPFFAEHGFIGGMQIVMPSFAEMFAQAKFVFGYMAWQAAMQLWVPAPTFHGPVSPSGWIPEYKANGMMCFVLSLLTYVGSVHYGYYDGGYVYEHFGALLGFMNVFALLFCLFLYVKGHCCPSGTDHGSSGNALIDYYWGMELYPRVFGLDLKQFTNCRFGMMAWALILVDFVAFQARHPDGVTDALVVGVALQLIYIAKFFWWETGYFCTIDIMHDRAGYYICWGCLCWLPCVYTSPSMFLVATRVTLGTPLALALLVAGATAIYVNYDTDEQRQTFRRTNGKALIWGSKPTYITATYTTAGDKKSGGGKTKTSLLLTSGYWGMSRHFNYASEITAAFLWSAPALFTHVAPYFYVIFLTVLLVDRAYRDDARCGDKYGKAWKKYCAAVPSRIIPGIL